MEKYLKELRNRHLKKRKEKNPDRPIATWVQDDIFRDKTNGKSITIILRTVGCKYAYDTGGCTMCSYLMDSSPIKITSENIINQFNGVLDKYKEELENNSKNYSIKLFTSGSFLDEFEVPNDAMEHIFKTIGELNVKEVAIESRPEYITNETMELIRKHINNDINVEIGVGIETANEEIRNISIHKGISNKDIEDAITTANKYAVGIKAYLLIKPPFITEKQAMEDSINSANKYIEMGVSRISFCPSSIHKGSLVELLWKKNQYRPPFLWTVIEILKEVKSKNPDKLIMCDTSGIPSNRGAHNKIDCECNYKIKEALGDYTLTQDLSLIENIDCECKTYWAEFMKYEEKNIVPLGDYER
ncbi:archaeosine biosynthesis radical SAM protein RaSEA [Methanococcus aeolicus]|uniref:Radical SAM domain protein n=1 Tax=Methanococcus aeolicus (strain ATCC BAA-1280 / DSM 17508 / OCM 812 / Nankai-3) TaxID=419665 RepID=A6UT16_META3|nr:archaeosine biosynthesis radical SAM protein RaSEA [Methanococcus aeolicus]ABR55638.1 Radical SAM domain protein [Methanococcus aeolicus Nankai-3]UXM85138.1 archaeosine biosynthesis radical SAM protein RaSEA [Methanococcus aeolicus]